MNLNLFLKELKRNTSGLLIWTIVIVLLESVTMAVYPTFMGNQSKIMGMLSIIPREALRFKGISDVADLLSVVGFYAANNVIYMMVLGSIYSIVLGSNIILKEEYDKTAEYLLSWPLTRDEIFLSKISVLILNILILNFVTALTGFIWIGIVKTGPFDIRAFMILSAYTVLLNFFFGAAGVFISVLIKKAKPVTAFSIGLVLIFYFIETISKLTANISEIGYLSPFRYAPTDVVRTGYSLSFYNVLFFAGFILMFIFFAISVYRKKDIYL